MTMTTKSKAAQIKVDKPKQRMTFCAAPDCRCIMLWNPAHPFCWKHRHLASAGTAPAGPDLAG